MQKVKLGNNDIRNNRPAERGNNFNDAFEANEGNITTALDSREIRKDIWEVLKV